MRHTPHTKRVCRNARSVLRVALLCSVFIAPSAVYANNDDDGFVMGASGKRFYALPEAGSAERSTMGARIVKPTSKTELRSDAAALRSGFLRIDRDRALGPRVASRVASRAAEVKSQANVNAEPMPAKTADAVTLALFDTEIARKQTFAGGIQHRWPLPANVGQKISSGYGMRNDPFHGQRRFHGGVDIAAPAGTSVLATADGRVKEAGFKRGFGNYVKLSHADGSETMYNHLQKVLARAGSLVRGGQQIGLLGSTGRSTGPHLDFRYTKSGQKLDPMQTALAGKAPSTLGKMPTQVASALSSRGVPFARATIRHEKGVRIITPRERIAMSGGFIRVR